MKGQAFPSLREAIHHTATTCGIPMKTLAAELDYSPTDLSMRTTLGDDSARAFPADDRLIKLQRLAGDISVLMTMADALGYELAPRRDRMPEIAERLLAEAKRLNETAEQLVLSSPWIERRQESRKR